MMLSYFLVLLCILVVADAKVSKIGYKVLVDAGSTGSRVYVYKYDKESPWDTVSELSHKRLHPALSAFTNDYQGLVNQMNVFVRFAKNYIEEEEWEHTDISLKATAGLRSISVDDQMLLINNVREVLTDSGFRFDPQDTRVISGKEEAMYGLIAVNTAFLTSDGQFSIGAADLGGSSTQISFMLPTTSDILKSNSSTVRSKHSNAIRNIEYNFNTSDVDASLLSTEEHRNQMNSLCETDYEFKLQSHTDNVSAVFARSLNGLGLISAMEAVIDMFLNTTQTPNSIPGELVNHFSDADEVDLMENEMSMSPDDAGIVEDDEDIEMTATTISVDSMINNNTTLFNPCLAPGAPFPYLESGYEVDLYGSGDFSQCVVLVKELLRDRASSESTCMQHVRPKLIVGMDNLPKVLEIMHLAKEAHVSPYSVRKAGEKICRRAWPEILHEFPTFMPYRAQRACFGASYVYSLLTAVYSLDEHDNTTFLPLEYHKDYTLGWPLGSAIFSAVGLNANDLLDKRVDADISVSGVVTATV